VHVQEVALPGDLDVELVRASQILAENVEFVVRTAWRVVGQDQAACLAAWAKAGRP
jgi:hypothetical protein